MRCVCEVTEAPFQFYLLPHAQALAVSDSMAHLALQSVGHCFVSHLASPSFSYLLSGVYRSVTLRIFHFSIIIPVRTAIAVVLLADNFLPDNVAIREQASEVAS